MINFFLIFKIDTESSLWDLRYISKNYETFKFRWNKLTNCWHNIFWIGKMFLWIAEFVKLDTAILCEKLQQFLKPLFFIECGIIYFTVKIIKKWTKNTLSMKIYFTTKSNVIASNSLERLTTLIQFSILALFLFKWETLKTHASVFWNRICLLAVFAAIR